MEIALEVRKERDWLVIGGNNHPFAIEKNLRISLNDMEVAVFLVLRHGIFFWGDWIVASGRSKTKDMTDVVAFRI